MRVAFLLDRACRLYKARCADIVARIARPPPYIVISRFYEDAYGPDFFFSINKDLK